MPGGDILEGIKIYRQKNGITQAALANILGVKQTTVAMWETNGSYPRAEMLPAIAKTLGCSIDALYDASA